MVRTHTKLIIMTINSSLTANKQNIGEQLSPQDKEKIIRQAWTEMNHKATK